MLRIEYCFIQNRKIYQKLKRELCYNAKKKLPYTLSKRLRTTDILICINPRDKSTVYIDTTIGLDTKKIRS